MHFLLTHLEEIKEDRFAKQVLNECCKIFGRRKKNRTWASRQRVSASSRAKFLCRTKSDTATLQFFVRIFYRYTKHVKGRLCNFRSILRAISVRYFKVPKIQNQRASSSSRARGLKQAALQFSVRFFWYTAIPWARHNWAV